VKAELQKLGMYMQHPQLKDERDHFLEDKEAFLQKDVVSHFILRMVFCKVRMILISA
jgi:hypothetical protein